MPSSSFTSSKWPCNAIPLDAALEAAGQSLSSVKCIKCDAKVNITTSSKFGHWLSCSNYRCNWCGYGFDYLVDKCDKDEDKAFAILRANKIKYRKSIREGPHKKLYSRHIEVLHNLNTWSRLAMAGRSIHSQPGIEHAPHKHPFWWFASGAEVEYLTKKKSKLNCDENKILFPAYDSMERVIGVAELENSVIGRKIIVPGTYGGLVFRHSIDKSKPAVLLPLNTAWMLQRRNSMDRSTTVPFVATLNPTEFYLKQMALDMQGIDWIMSPNCTNITTWGLASIFDAKVIDSDINLFYKDITPKTLYDSCLSKSKPWLTSLQYQLTLAPDPMFLKPLLNVVNWTNGTREKAKHIWPRSTYERAENAMSTPTSNCVEVSPGFWVTDSTKGWICSSTNETLAEAVPEIFSVTREAGRVYHSGVIRYKGGIYKFKSRKFRQDPAGVIENCLLQHGVTNPVPPHPKILKHMVSLSLYFARPR